MAEKALPRYQLLAQELQRRIQEGLYPVGSLLPPELDLCADFDCSRHTIREALRVLTSAGYVQRRQGSGSQVMERAPNMGYRQTMRSLDQLYQYAADTSFEADFIGVTTPDEAYARDFGQSELIGRDYLTIKGIRADKSGAVICGVEVYIHDRYMDLREEIGPKSSAYYKLLERKFGVKIESVQQVFRAMPVSVATANLLGISRRSWIVRVTRRYITEAGECAIIAINDHAADRFSYEMEMSREGAKL